MKFVSRREWKARPPQDPPSRITAIRGVALHYTAMNADEMASHANCAGRVRGIQNYHMDHNGWNDIAYSFVYCKHGYVFEGRGFGVRTAAQGTNHGNDHYHAYCFLGDDTANRDDLGSGGRTALNELVRWGQQQYPTGQEVWPHSNFNTTACPGNEIRAIIADAPWKRRRRTALRLVDFEFGRWYLGIGEFKKVGRRHKPSRPRLPDGRPYPRRVPLRGWRAVRYYQKIFNL